MPSASLRWAAGPVVALTTLAGVEIKPLDRPMPIMRTIKAPGADTPWNATDVTTSAMTPGAITRRAPKRSTHAPTVGRSTIDTMVLTEKSRPTWVRLPPRSKT